MNVTLERFMKDFTDEDRAYVKSRAAQLIAEERTLRDLRQAHSLTQERMANLLGVSQESVSRIERRTDMLLSTLTSYIEAMGGTLKLVAEFPDKTPVTIQAICDLSDLPHKPNHLVRKRTPPK